MDCHIETFTVTPEQSDFTKLRASMGRDEYVPPGDYRRLYVGNTLMMSNTPFELRTNRAFIHGARGDILIAGLGIGVIVDAILTRKYGAGRESIGQITIIEKYRGVIDVVGPEMAELERVHDAAIEVICADIFEWKAPRGMKWDTIYFDIWPNSCTDNLVEIAKLKRRFAKRKRPGGWMSAWQEGHLRALRRTGW